MDLVYIAVVGSKEEGWRSEWLLPPSEERSGVKSNDGLNYSTYQCLAQTRYGGNYVSTPLDFCCCKYPSSIDIVPEAVALQGR